MEKIFTFHVTKMKLTLETSEERRDKMLAKVLNSKVKITLEPNSVMLVDSMLVASLSLSRCCYYYCELDLNYPQISL